MLQLDGAPSLPFPLGERARLPLTRWLALDGKRVALGAASDSEEKLRSYATGLQVVRVRVRVRVGVRVRVRDGGGPPPSLRRAAGEGRFLSYCGLLMMPPTVAAYPPGGLPRLLHDEIRPTARRRCCQHLGPATAAAAV